MVTRRWCEKEARIVSAQVYKFTSVQVNALSVQVSVVTRRWCEKEARIATNSLREASDGSTYCE